MERHGDQRRPSRVLHVVGGMNRAGAETWLMDVRRSIDRDRFDLTFLVHTDAECAFDPEIRSLGSRIISCSPHTRPLEYAMKFMRILGRHGPFDIIHSHVHHFTGFILFMAHRAGIPMRIAHSHNDIRATEARSGKARRCYYLVMKRLIRRYATHGLSCSGDAAASLFGARWSEDPRRRVIHHGIDCRPFEDSPDRARLRAELGLPEKAFTIGHVGRFSEQKNHSFLMDVFSALSGIEPDAHLLLVGDGDLRPRIESMAAGMGLAGRVSFLGSRSDVPRLMLGAMDAFVFPSRHEGLGLVLIEAQAAGIPVVISDVIPQQAIVSPRLVRRLALSDPAPKWAATILECRRLAGQIDREEQLAIVKRSSFNIQASVRELMEIYGGG